MIEKVIMKFFVRNRITRFFAKRYINKYDGGELFSPLLRKIFRQYYGVNIGVGTYGCFFLISYILADVQK